MRDDQKTKAELGPGAGGKKPIKEAEKLRARKAKLERVSSELTKRKNADEKLYKARADWEKTFDAISDWIALIDLKGRILRTNRSGEDFTGISSDQIVGQSCCKLVHGSEEYIPGCPLQKMLHSRQRERAELKVPDTNRWLLVTVDPIVDKEGNLVGVVHITRDVTERKRAEEALRESEEKYRSIFNTAASLITSIGANGVIVDCNARIKDVFGYERDEVVGQSIAKILHPDYMERAKTCLNEVLTVGFARHKEYKMVRKDNKVINVEINAAGIKNKQGKYVEGIYIIEDITERKRAEEALRESQKNYRMVSRLSSDYIVKTKVEPNGQMVFVSATDRLVNMTGYTVDELRSQSSWSKIVHPDDFDKFQDFWKRIVSSRKSCELEFRGIDRKQQFEWLHAYGQPILDEKNDRVISIVFAAKDITEQKQAEEAYRSLVDHSLQGLAIFQNGRAVFANQAMADITGYTVEEMLTLPPEQVQAFVHPEDRELVWSRHRGRLNGEELPERYEFRGIRKDGSTCWLEIHASRIEFQGKPAIQAAYVDITERKKVEDSLKESKEHAKIFASYQHAISELREFYVREASFEQMLQKTTDLFVKNFGYHMAWYGELRPDEKVIIPKVWAGKYEKYLDGLRLVLDDSKDVKCAMSLAIVNKEPFGYADLEHDKDFEKWRPLALQYGYRSNQAIPLIIDGKSVGAFLVYSTHPRAFSEDLIRYLVGIANELATIVENITERKRAEEALQKRTEELTIMNEMAIELAVASSTADIYKLVCEKLKGITGALFTGITSYDSQRQELSIEHISTDSKFIITANKILGRKVKEFRIPLEPRHIQEMLSEKAKRLEGLNELMFGTIPRAVVNTLKRALKIGDVYGLGLHYGGKIIGTMTVLMPQQKPLLSIEMLQAFANLVATSLKRKKAEEALRDSESKYRTLVENLPQKIFLKDKNSVYVSCNDNLAKDLKIRSEEITGKTDYDLAPKALADKYRADDKRIIESGETEAIEEKYIEDGEERIIHTVKTPVKDEQGNTIGVLGIFWDITELKQAQEKLNKYREQMAKAEQLASVGTLSATLAHELTQPLTVIRLSIQNSLAELEKRSCPDTVVEDLKEGLSEISGLISIIDRFRNFARISSERTVSKVDLKAVAERIVKLLDESAWRAKVTLQVEGMDKLPPIYSHEKDLERLFFSLIENSIQAADGKKSRQVIISSVVKDEHIELRFSDNCSGIAPGNLDRIFEPFFTTKPIGRRTGLGLCVLERIVSRLGGKVRVESKLGKGSTFFVTLPIKRDES